MISFGGRMWVLSIKLNLYVRVLVALHEQGVAWLGVTVGGRPTTWTDRTSDVRLINRQSGGRGTQWCKGLFTHSAEGLQATRWDLKFSRWSGCPAGLWPCRLIRRYQLFGDGDSMFFRDDPPTSPHVATTQNNIVTKWLPKHRVSITSCPTFTTVMLITTHW